MNNMKVTKEKAVRFKETDQFCDIINTISDRCGVPVKICVTEQAIICLGNQKTMDKDETTYITFQELGYRDLYTHMEKDGVTYNEVQLVALSIYDFYKEEGVKEGLNYSFGFPVAEDIIGIPSKDGKEWSMAFRKEAQKGEKSWITYAILGLFLGAYGIHNFYAGQKKKGIIKLVVTCTLIGAVFSQVWAFYEIYEAYKNKKIPD